MKRRDNKVLIYLGIPGVGGLLLIFSYFFGPFWLRNLIAPQFNLEYGLLEHIQSLLLVGIGLISLVGFRRSESLSFRGIWGLIFLGTLFILLEELDYGLHYYRLWIGNPLCDQTEGLFFNIHNQGNNTAYFKRFANIFMILFFVLVPWFGPRSRNQILQRISPSRMMVATMVLMFFLSKGAHWLNDHFPPFPNPLEHRISEFREVMIYYIFLIYLYELVFCPVVSGLKSNKSRT